eukprot:5389913-Pyramimonas_sp.AAC.1
MSLTLAAAKGRAASHRLLGVCRVLFAVGVAAYLKVQVRWLPSEWNPSDGPSRRFQPQGPKSVHGGGDAPGGAAHAGGLGELPLRPSRAERAQE